MASVELKTVSGGELFSWDCPRSMSVPKALGLACGEAEEMVLNSPGMNSVLVFVYEGAKVRKARVTLNDDGQVEWITVDL